MQPKGEGKGKGKGKGKGREGGNPDLQPRVNYGVGKPWLPGIVAGLTFLFVSGSDRCLGCAYGDGVSQLSDGVYGDCSVFRPPLKS